MSEEADSTPPRRTSHARGQANPAARPPAGARPGTLHRTETVAALRGTPAVLWTVEADGLWKAGTAPSQPASHNPWKSPPGPPARDSHSSHSPDGGFLRGEGLRADTGGSPHPVQHPLTSLREIRRTARARARAGRVLMGGPLERSRGGALGSWWCWSACCWSRWCRSGGSWAPGVRGPAGGCQRGRDGRSTGPVGSIGGPERSTPRAKRAAVTRTTRPLVPCSGDHAAAAVAFRFRVRAGLGLAAGVGVVLSTLASGSLSLAAASPNRNPTIPLPNSSAGNVCAFSVSTP